MLNSLRVPVGASSVVFGAGAVGLAAVMAARVAGADPIIAVDINDERLELARSLGATHVVNGKNEDTSARILEITRRGADFIVDLTGSPKMLGMAVEALARAPLRWSVRHIRAHKRRSTWRPSSMAASSAA